MYALIATHNAALRSAIMVLLRICHPGCHVVLANDVADVHEALESGRCDTMLVDVQFTGYGTSFDATMLRGYYPGVNFLPLGSAGGSQAILGALERGLDAANYEAPPHPSPDPASATSLDHLLRAIEVIGSSQVMSTPSAPMPAEHPIETGPALTGRQRDVLNLLGEGRSTKDIARRLGLAVPTVKTHLAALYRQLGARNRVEAVVKAGMSRGRPTRARSPLPMMSLQDSGAFFTTPRA
jgi:DNA-binding NarL/FixJ family response regulator